MAIAEVEQLLEEPVNRAWRGDADLSLVSFPEPPLDGLGKVYATCQFLRDSSWESNSIGHLARKMGSELEPLLGKYPGRIIDDNDETIAFIEKKYCPLRWAFFAPKCSGEVCLRMQDVDEEDEDARLREIL
ncbi:hypothetical protein DUI87_17411 [Hirundo rustica rustica]|uniref:Uncharacterized protein n=1 Tax=Hirundo rustica rustica TaxID=333673 RepID=A0A3M0JYN6_HIRRU|nr:hypothetical protein DUI87_17411 [Hirundo rustica rustica]